MALSTRNVIKRLYEYAIARQLAPTNPAQAVVARFIATQDNRTRVLSPDETGTVLRAVYAPDIRRPLKLAIHLLVLTCSGRPGRRLVRRPVQLWADFVEAQIDEGRKVIIGKFGIAG
jgi:hypothetical protein